MRTYQPSSKDIKREWHTVNADNQVLGRLASEIARVLMGKDKSTYSQNIDSGDFVVVLNSEKVKLTGNKENSKVYRSHSGYPGGFKEVSIAYLRAKNPRKILEHAVSGMLPDNRLKDKRMKRLKIVIGENNPYAKK